MRSVVLLGATAGIATGGVACSRARSESPAVIVGADPDRGARTIQAYGCGSCHLVPGIDGADGMVGPPLTHFARRVFIAGRLPNVPDSLVRWIVNPQRYEPGSAMPNLDVVERDARDIAAYLYTLR